MFPQCPRGTASLPDPVNCNAPVLRSKTACILSVIRIRLVPRCMSFEGRSWSWFGQDETGAFRSIRLCTANAHSTRGQRTQREQAIAGPAISTSEEVYLTTRRFACRRSHGGGEGRPSEKEA